jgi:hypothetical protein
MVLKILQGQTGNGSVKPETLFETAEKTVCGQRALGPETGTGPVGNRLRHIRLDNGHVSEFLRAEISIQLEHDPSRIERSKNCQTSLQTNIRLGAEQLRRA